MLFSPYGGFAYVFSVLFEKTEIIFLVCFTEKGNRETGKQGNRETGKQRNKVRDTKNKAQISVFYKEKKQSTGYKRRSKAQFLKKQKINFV